MSTREEAKLHGDLRADGEALLELISADLEKYGLQSTIDFGQRSYGQDGFVCTVPADLDVKDALNSAVMAITKFADGKPIVFSRWKIPDATHFYTNLHNQKQTVIGSVIRAFDPVENKFIRRLDFLFKVVEPSGLNGPGEPESAVTPPEPSTKE